MNKTMKKIDMNGRPKKASTIVKEAISDGKKIWKGEGVKKGVDLVGIAKELTNRRAENLKLENKE